MKTLQITIPEGHELDSFDQATGQIKFRPIKPKAVTERILTVADALDELGETDPDVKDLRRLSTEFSGGHHLVNYQLAVCIAKSLNGDWVPDWSNSSETKYYPWFYMDKRGSSGFRFLGYDYWGSSSYVGSRLCFKTSELAEHAGRLFTEVYKRFMVIE